MHSKAATVEKYLAELPPDRRREIQTVRNVILKNLDRDYEEGMQYGMISYCVPHSVYPPGYHCDPNVPLPFALLASQKNYMSLYLMSVYGDSSPENEWFHNAWTKTGKKLDMGKSCVRFKRAEDLALDVIGEAIRRVPAKRYIKFCESVMQNMRSRPTKTAKSKRAAASPKSKVKKPAGARAKSRK
jgi:hypothetical protein